MLNRISRRSFLAGSAAVLSAAALAGCGGSSSGSAAGNASGSAAPRTHEDKLTVALTSEPPQISTCDHDSLISVGINMLTFNGLTRIDNGTLQPELDLAESYTVENEVDWVFKLKQGVKFHDGSELTAADVVASIENAKSYSGSANYTRNMVSEEAVDDYTVKITTDGPYAGLLYDLGYHYNWVVPKALLDAGHDFNAEPIGSGPYKFVEWKKGDSLSFTRFDDYFDEARKAKIKDLVFKIIPEGASRTSALEAHEVDFVWEANMADADVISADSSLYLNVVDTVDNVNLFYNNDIAGFSDKNFRHAINSAINREDIIAGALSGYGSVNYALFPPALQGYTTENTDTYDLALAADYISAWGGDPASVPMDILVSNETRATIGNIIAGSLADIGVNVTVTQLDTAAYFDRVATPDYVTWIASWSPSNSLTYIQRFNSARREAYPGSYNATPEMDALIAKCGQTLDETERIGLITDVLKQVNEDCPQSTLYVSQWLRAYDADLQGVVCSGTGYTDWNMMSWG